VNLVEHFRQVFAYDDWANREVLNKLRECPNARSLQLFAHILSAERVWFERVQAQKQTFPVWPDFSLETCSAQAEEISTGWKQYLALANDSTLQFALTYKNSIGETWTSNVGDILTHVILHSAYHRGQIAADMRASGHTPAHTDFIHGIRQGLVE